MRSRAYFGAESAHWNRLRHASFSRLVPLNLRAIVMEPVRTLRGQGPQPTPPPGTPPVPPPDPDRPPPVKEPPAPIPTPRPEPPPKPMEL